MLLCVPPHDLARWWPSAGSALLPAIDRTDGAQSLETVRESIQSGDAHLWVIASGWEAQAALVTYVFRTPTGQRWLRSSLCGGSGLDRMAQALPQIERWAAENDCKKSEIAGRKGWGRALDGYREVASVFVKDLG